MIAAHRQILPPKHEHVPSTSHRISVVVRKRPIFKEEELKGEIDAVSARNPFLWVHEPKKKVDGITNILMNNDFIFDNTFDECDSSADVYNWTLGPLCDFICRERGTVTCMAYGETGSGKTFTMEAME
jgi:kinesin family protein 2/24